MTRQVNTSGEIRSWRHVAPGVGLVTFALASGGSIYVYGSITIINALIAAGGSTGVTIAIKEGQKWLAGMKNDN